MVGVVESAMPSVSANPLLVAYQRAGFLGGENGEAPEKRRTRREIAKDICDAAVEDLRRSWETRALLPLYRSLEAASSKNARGTVDVILRDLQDTRRTLEQLIAYLESEPGLDAAELCLARHEEKCDVLETSGVIDNRIFQDPILDAPEKVLQRIRDQFRNDAQNDVIAELYSAILNAPQQPDPIADGPFGIDGFRFQGQERKGLTGKPFFLLKHLWNAKDRTARFESLAESVWADRNHIVDNGVFGSVRAKANNFLQRHGFPFRVKSRNYVAILEDLSSEGQENRPRAKKRAPRARPAR